MNDERKKLMPELLPKPQTAIPSTSVRQRVLKHLNLLIAAGATTATLACQPYGVVDPLPPPAKCRTTGSVLDVLNVLAFTDTSGVTVRIWIESEEVRLLRIMDVTGAVAAQAELDTGQPWIHLIPDSPAATITLKLATECAGMPAAAVRIVLTPGAGDSGMEGHTVTLSDESP